MRAKLTLLLAAVTACSNPGIMDDDDAPPDGPPGPPPPDARSTPEADASPPAGAPIDGLDDLALVIVLGDSLAAGYNAAGGNGPGGHGYARLLFDELAAARPGLAFRDLADSGADSTEVLANLRGASLPAPAGDVLVLINAGGNDFNDSLAVMLNTDETMAAAARLRANLAEMARLLRGRYQDPAAGRRVELLIDNVQDSTDGMGTVPAQFQDGFCGTIQNPLFTAPLRARALANLGLMNDAIAAETAAQAGHLVDLHAAFLGHGMNAGADRLIDGDCVHPTSGGHALIRDLARAVLYSSP